MQSSRRRTTVALAVGAFCCAASAKEGGEYLAILGDCAACHTEPGGRPFAGGRALLFPWN